MTRTSTKAVKVLAAGDLHFDDASRWAECLRIHGWIAEQVEREKPAAFLCPGDVYERRSTPVERAAVAEWLQRIAEVCPVVVARGNHDFSRDCELLGRLKAPHPIVVEERCGVYRLASGLVVGAVAWPSRSSLAAMVGRPVNSEALDQAAEHELGNVLRGLGAEMDRHDGPRVLMGHFMIDGSRVSLGQPPLVGAELRVSLATLGLARAQMTIAGHIHYAQDWAFDGAPIVYTGSPYRNTFGETEEKSIVIADISRKGVEWTRLPTPATPMVLLECAWRDGRLEHPPSDCITGAEVRLRVTVDSDQRDAARHELALLRSEMLAAGAVSVKVEEQVRATTRARVPEIATAATLEDKLRACWRSRSIVVDQERERRLFGKLAELEQVPS